MKFNIVIYLFYSAKNIDEEERDGEQTFDGKKKEIKFMLVSAHIEHQNRERDKRSTFKTTTEITFYMRG